MLEPVVLTGSLTRLEPLSLDHVPALVAASSASPSAYRFNLVPQDEAGMVRLVEAALAARQIGDTLAFATIRRSDGAVVGSTRFVRAEYWPWPDDNPLRRPDGTPDAVEVGYTWLAVSAQRTGVNVEAKRLMFAHAFETWGVRRVSLITDARNEQSRTAIAAVGGRFEGVLRAHRVAADGIVRDSARFSIVADEWPDVRRLLDDRLARFA
jgi:N-acetyltransferase